MAVWVWPLLGALMALLVPLPSPDPASLRSKVCAFTVICRVRRPAERKRYMSHDEW